MTLKTARVKASVVEEFEERAYSVIFPTYGNKQNFNDTLGAIATLPNKFQSDLLYHVKLLKKSAVFQTVDELVTHLLECSYLIQWTSSYLNTSLHVAQVSSQEFEVRHGSPDSLLAWDNAVIEKASASNMPLELGYRSMRLSPSGEHVEEIRAYFGLVEKFAAGVVTLKLTENVFRSFQLRDVLWLVKTPRRARKEPVAHQRMNILVKRVAGDISFSFEPKPVDFSAWDGLRREQNKSSLAPLALALGELASRANELEGEYELVDSPQWQRVMKLIETVRG